MNKENKNMEEEIVDFVVTPYALADVLLALHNDEVKEIYVTEFKKIKERLENE